MNGLVEEDSVKAARILDSARELVLEHGIRKVTISEIAESAGVGKGTVYLYWDTKETLVLGLFARELLTWLDTIITRIDEDPATVLPRRLAPLLIRTGLENPWLRRLQASDVDVLRLLAHHTDNRDRFAAASPSSMCHAVMPVLRDHGLVRTDRPLAEQAYAMHAILMGFGAVLADPKAAGPLHLDHGEDVLADTVHQLLGPPRDPAEPAVVAAAQAVRATFTAVRSNVFELIS